MPDTHENNKKKIDRKKKKNRNTNEGKMPIVKGLKE